MKVLIISGFIFGIMFSAIGCRSTTTEITTNINNDSAKINANVNANINANTNLPPQDAELNSQNLPADPLANVQAGDSITNHPSKKDSDAQTDQKAVPNSAKVPVERLNNAIAAPDDSVFSMIMDEKGNPVETRVFAKHPILAKVERKVFGMNQSTTRVHLRDGKVLPMAEGKIRDLAIAPPALILEAVGVQPPASADSKEKKEQ